MSRKVLVAGGPTEARGALARALDAAFDVDVEEADDALAVLRLLPNRSLDVIVLLADVGGAGAIDLVRLIRSHVLHGHVPVIHVGGDTAQRSLAAAAGAWRLEDTDPAAVCAAVGAAIGLG